MERFNSVVAQYYPDATLETDFVADSFQQLNKLGFGRNNTIACMGTCRENSTRMLHAEIVETLGSVSRLDMNGCIITADALDSFLDVPTTTDRPHFLFIVLAHIGIGPATGCADLDEIQRECMHAQSDWHSRLSLEDDLSPLRQQLAPYLQESAPSLIELTFHAHNALVDNLQDWIEQRLDSAETNYAVLSGIQLFGDSEEQLLWPGIGYAVVGGQRHVLDLDLELV